VRRTWIALSALCIALQAIAASARTWKIAADGSGDAQTIQAGIDSAAVGDSVLVGGGRFLENIDFKGKAIVVKGSGPENSTIDGSSHPESCVRFQSGERHTSVLEGFTLTAGTGSCPVPGCHFGGGVYIFDSEPSVRMNLITQNSATNWGGGVYCSAPNFVQMTPLVEQNVIEYNRADRNGGGIAVEAGSAPVIRNNTFRSNEAVEGDGGGIWIFVNTDGTTVTGNLITGNLAGDHGGGILATSSSSPRVFMEIVSNLIVNNTARGTAGYLSSGGGILLGFVHLWFHQNTLAFNAGEGPDSSWGGGNMAIHEGDQCLIEKNVIAFASIGGGIRCTGSTQATIQNNLTWMNSGGNGSGTCETWWQGNGNVIDDPHFCDVPVNDFTVAANSHVITHPAGPLGAFPSPGCGPVAVHHSTWGSLKARYSRNN